MFVYMDAFKSKQKETHPASNTSGHREKQQLFAKDPFSLLGCSALPSCTGSTKMQLLTSSGLGGTQPLPYPSPHHSERCFMCWVLGFGLRFFGWLF